MFQLILPILLTTCIYAYDESLSKYIVELAQATYSISSIDDWNCITCNTEIKLDYVVEQDNNLALQGFDTRTNSIFTAFRGSANIQNWLENIKIRKIAPYNDSSITVEKGFYQAYNNVKTAIFDNLQLLSVSYNTNKLLITGHSMGAAMSTLMVYDVYTLYPIYEIPYFYNYGSPRVGNDNFVKSFNSFSTKYYRITHYYDIVPHVPEEFLGYSHISNEIWYNEDNTVDIICDDFNIEDNTCSNSCSPTHCTSTSDHLYYLNVTMGTT